VRIPQSHRHGLVPEQLLNVLQIPAPHDDLAGKSVPQVVKSEISDPGIFQSRFKRLLYIFNPFTFISKYIFRY